MWCWSGGRFRQFTTAQGLLSDYCHALASLPNGDLLVVHPHGLSRFDAARQAFVPQVSAANPLVRDCLTRGAVVDASGTAWVTTRTGCLRLLPTAALLPPLNVVLH